MQRLCEREPRDCAEVAGAELFRARNALASLEGATYLVHMQTCSERATQPLLLLNRSKLDELRRANGIRSEAELARRLGVNAATLYRVSAGLTAPSNQFMAGLKVAFPLVPLDDFLTLKAA